MNLTIKLQSKHSPIQSNPVVANPGLRFFFILLKSTNRYFYICILACTNIEIVMSHFNGDLKLARFHFITLVTISLVDFLLNVSTFFHSITACPARKCLRSIPLGSKWTSLCPRFHLQPITDCKNAFDSRGMRPWTKRRPFILEKY